MNKSERARISNPRLVEALRDAGTALIELEYLRAERKLRGLITYVEFRIAGLAFGLVAVALLVVAGLSGLATYLGWPLAAVILSALCAAASWLFYDRGRRARLASDTVAVQRQSDPSSKV